MTTLSGKTLFITGGSRGIGRAIALRAAKDGANVVIAAKTADPHPKLAGTIHTVADEVRKAGGKALPVQLDVRDENAIVEAVKKAAQEFGGIDILVNNASAISITPTMETPASFTQVSNPPNRSIATAAIARTSASRPTSATA